jgi:diketogulonate reductase-like aldo/keto reductase
LAEDLEPSSERLFPFLPNKKMETVNIPIEETWRELEKLVDEGLIRNIGVSNFNIKQTEELLSIARIHPAVNQVEVHPYWPNKELREFSASKNIHISAYSPLGTPDSQPDSKKLMDDPTVNEIAKKYNKQAANVLIHWIIQNKMSVLPKSVTDSRIVSNLAESVNFELKEEDFNTLNDIGFSLRYNDPSKWWGVKCFEDSPDV